MKELGFVPSCCECAFYDSVMCEQCEFPQLENSAKAALYADLESEFISSGIEDDDLPW